MTKAFLDYAAPEIRLFRNGHHPFMGADGINRALSKISPDARVIWEPANGDLSTSADLGYTYGSYTVTDKTRPETVIERGNYMRVWKRHDGFWKLVLDVENVIPTEK